WGPRWGLVMAACVGGGGAPRGAAGAKRGGVLGAEGPGPADDDDLHGLPSRQAVSSLTIGSRFSSHFRNGFCGWYTCGRRDFMSARDMSCFRFLQFDTQMRFENGHEAHSFPPSLKNDD